MTPDPLAPADPPRYDDCTLCEDFPGPVFSPTSSLADMEAHLTELLAQARLTFALSPGVIVLVPAAVRGYELFLLEPGLRADLVLTALGRPPR
jgi:hypothetical protein